ncbi:MAG: hypothetical protein ACYC8T_24560 [Myxococcaceae bacterium]
MSLVASSKAHSLGGVRTGLSPEEVESLLGPPEDVSLRKGRRVIFRYGSLQVFFDQLGRAVQGFVVYFRMKEVKVPDACKDGVWPLVPGLSQEQAERLMQKEGLEVAGYQPLTFGDQSCLRIAPGVVAIFDHGVIDSLQWFPPEEEVAAAPQTRR